MCANRHDFLTTFIVRQTQEIIAKRACLFHVWNVSVGAADPIVCLTKTGYGQVALKPSWATDERMYPRITTFLMLTIDYFVATCEWMMAQFRSEGRWGVSRRFAKAAVGARSGVIIATDPAYCPIR